MPLAGSGLAKGLLHGVVLAVRCEQGKFPWCAWRWEGRPKRRFSQPPLLAVPFWLAVSGNYARFAVYMATRAGWFRLSIRDIARI